MHQELIYERCVYKLPPCTHESKPEAVKLVLDELDFLKALLLVTSQLRPGVLGTTLLLQYTVVQ